MVDSTNRLLDVFEQHEVKATFFVLGWVARKHPSLVQRIEEKGHEIGSHSYWHHLVYRQSPKEFREDLRASIEAISDATGQIVRSYRAPSFSITSECQWAFEVLAEEGIEFDSSVFPVRHDRYGIPSASRMIHRVETDSGDIWEFPLTTKRLGGVSLPIAGGGYFRLYPVAWTNRWLQEVNNRFEQPFVFYIHPWELDCQQPRLKIRSRLSRFRHYLNLEHTQRKLDCLLQHHEFTTLSSVIEATRLRGLHPVEDSSPTLST